MGGGAYAVWATETGKRSSLGKGGQADQECSQSEGRQGSDAMMIIETL